MFFFGKWGNFCIYFCEGTQNDPRLGPAWTYSIFVQYFITLILQYFFEVVHQLFYPAHIVISLCPFLRAESLNHKICTCGHHIFTNSSGCI